MDKLFSLDDSQALLLVETYRGIYCGGSGYAPSINSLKNQGLMQYDENEYYGQLTNEGKKFARQYIESINELILKELTARDYRDAMTNISRETNLSWGVLESIFLENLVCEGRVNKYITLDSDSDRKIVFKVRDDFDFDPDDPIVYY